jgi:hypothetical protein
MRRSFQERSAGSAHARNARPGRSSRRPTGWCPVRGHEAEQRASRQESLDKRDAQHHLYGVIPAKLRTMPAADLIDELVLGDRRASHLHNEYLERYRYLGYQPLPGAQQRYFVRAGGAIVALLGFGAAAWKCRARDAFIGWSPAPGLSMLESRVPAFT